jgi:beta-glucosidase
VTDIGTRAGVAVPQAYLTYPTSTGEPPAQMVAFSPVALTPHRSRTVTLDIPSATLQVYLSHGWTTVPGTYVLSVGPSSSDLPLSVSLSTP